MKGSKIFVAVIAFVFFLAIHTGFAAERKLVMVGWGGSWEETMNARD